MLSGSSKKSRSVSEADATPAEDSVLAADIQALSVELGAAVRQSRLARKMTQAALASAAGLDPNYIGMVERAERRITLYNAWRIAGGLNMSLAELVVALPSRASSAG